MDLITLEDLKKVNIRIGRVINCERIEGSDKMLRLEVDFGIEYGKKQILTGLGKFFEPEAFIGKQMPFIVNLAPRKMMGLESHGMIMAIDSENPVFLLPEEEVENGTPVI